MFFSLSKIIDFLLLPICWIILFNIYAIFQKNHSKSRKAIIFSLFILLVCSNGFFTNILYQHWELSRPKNLPKNRYTWGIILGGGIIRNTGVINKDLVFAESNDRLLQTFILYKKGIIKKIIITGGNTSISHLSLDFAQESIKSKQFLIMMGIKPEDIFVENQAKNTYENAVNCKRKLKNYIQNDSMIVITSAYHSRRAKACFEKQGFHFIIYPVDPIAKEGNIGLLHQIIPEEKNLYLSSKLIREITGFFIYKMMGYC
jgi:uncharacterized SAM-binding protein YcdF (DUF218 family)